MRPLRLEVKGFTSFRGAQAIDFTELDLFAIVGPTGSGKSSLLDAITYALFGEVDRVGRAVSQLVSQGQPRMAVALEFEVGHDRYRVTRSTAASRTGATKVLLEVAANGDGWRQAGEGADRVRDVNAALRRAIGLDYDAFTRSVLLPQGRFAEFLVGEARERREILTELLGLELFTRLARRAGEERSSAATAAQAKADLLEAEYGSVSRPAVREATRSGQAAAARERALSTAARKVRALARKHERSRAEADELRSCAADVAGVSGEACRIAAELEGLSREAAEAARGLEAARRGAAALADERAAARDARERREAEWGPITDLVAMRARAEDLDRRCAEIGAVERELSRAAASVPVLRRRLRDAEAKLARAGAQRSGGERALRSARAAVERAQHADLVAAVRMGVSAGDPCPICGTAIDELPPASGSDGLAEARRLEDAAARRLATLDEGLRAAERARERADAEAVAAEAGRERIERDLADRRADAARLHAELTAALGSEVDPSVVGERIEALERLELVERTASDAASRAELVRAQAERDLAAVRSRIAERRAALAAQPVAALLRRARRLAGPAAPVDEIPSPLPPSDEGEAVTTAAALRDRLRDLAGALERIAAERDAAADELRRRAEDAVGGLVEPVAGGLEDLADATAEAAREAAAATATARERADRMRERLRAAEALADDARALRVRADGFAALARELRADRIIEFLQLEALQLLAAAGSERLATLSDGRYRLAFEAEEFFVVDTWNGEDTRSARTLSGGETFLASLALALALSEQVQSLAVSRRARLDSLFLDEGFGTLDPETLETVVGAIEQLGGDGRMVGVITHVQELAIRLPARVEVGKSPSGSSLRVVS